MLVVDRIQLLIHLKNNNKHGSLTNIFYNFVSAKFLKMRADIFSSVRLLIVP